MTTTRSLRGLAEFAAGLELASSIKTYLKGKIDSYKVPSVVEFIPELPKTSTGKIRRFLLRQQETMAVAKPIADSTAMTPREGEGKVRPSGPAPEPVTLRYEVLRQICRYQDSGTCTLVAGRPHKCTLSMCQLVGRGNGDPARLP